MQELNPSEVPGQTPRERRTAADRLVPTGGGGTAATERLKRRERQALFGRLEDAARRAAADQSGPTVADIAEATGAAADDIRRELDALRAERVRAAEAAKSRSREVLRRVSLGTRCAAAAAVGLGVIWLGLAKPNFGVVGPEEGASVAAWHERQGQQQFSAGRYRTAESQFQMAAALEPGVAGYREELGEALLSQQKYAEALPQFQKAVQTTPDRPDYALDLAETYRRMKRYGDAASAFRVVINLDSSSATAYEGLGFSLNELDRTAEAEKVLRAARRLSPENADIANQLGFALAIQERWADAAAQFRQAAALDPSRDTFRKNLTLAEEVQRIGIDAMMRKYPVSTWQLTAE